MPHISVCICTYKRARLLERLLHELRLQRTDGRFTYSVVVADNDGEGSAEAVVRAAAAAGGLAVRYCVEPRQNIALARNMAVTHARGDFVAFIDDDELPRRDWLLTLFQARQRYDVDGVLGPVKPHFEQAPPRWVVKGKFYERRTYPTGFRIAWRQGRTGNVLLKRTLLAADPMPFRPEFRTGEDQDFFRRMIARGHVFVWCDEAVAYETVPPERWTRTFMVRRALLRGAVSRVHPTFGALDVVKSVVAAPVYAALLPFAFALGQDRFMRFLIPLCDHLGRLLALLGVHPVKEPYVVA